jgi:tetratricopeptide (TPR) repeat protein/type IV secretory pathway VirB2 component (pilin)
MILYFNTHKNIFFTFLILVFLFYGNSLRNKYALDDDYVTVTNLPEKGKDFVPNHKLVSKGFKGILGIWKSRYAHDSEGSFDYRPFTTTTFAIEYAIFGQNPFVSHLINLLLYFITIWLIFCCLLKLFEENNYNFSLALICALFFLIHPAHTEVVDNLKCRDELLAFSCSLCALWFSLEAYKKPTFKAVVMVILFLLMGLFSKKTAILFIAVIPMCLLFFRKLNFKKAAFIVFSILIVIRVVPLVKKNVINEDVVRHFYHFENPLYTDSVPFFQKIIIGIKTFGFYVKFLFFPYPFRNYYGANTFDLNPDLNIYFFIAITFIAICGYYIYKYKSRLLLFATLLFCGCILPFTNIGTPAPGILAERFAYFSSMGFCLILSIAVVHYIKNIQLTSISQFFRKPLVYGLPAVIICMFYVWNRNANWYNKVVLFEHDIVHLEKSSKANSLLANEYFEMLRSTKKKYPDQVLVQKCLKHYSIAVTNDSTFFSAYNNAGVIYFSYLNDIPSAKKQFLLGIKNHPKYAQAYENLGNCYKKEKNADKAFECYNKSIQINPKQYSAYMASINMFFELKQYDTVINIIHKAYDEFPSNYELTAQEANSILMKGDTANAISKYEEAYGINPNQNLARFLSQKYQETGNQEKSELYKYK